MEAALISYGGLGILALASMIAAARLYIDNVKQDAKHREELQVMLDRYIEGHRNVSDRYHQFAERLYELVVRLESKLNGK